MDLITLNFNLIIKGIRNGAYVVSRKYDRTGKQASTACRKLYIVFTLEEPAMNK